MTDIVERLRRYAVGNPGPVTQVCVDAIAALSSRDREIERLTALLRSCPCPGGGWNGMPAGLEPTVGACQDHKTCGCVYGAALSTEQPCQTCNDDPEVCATVPGLRHCEKAQRDNEQSNEAKDG